MFRNVAELVKLAENKGEKIFDMIQQEMKCIVLSKETLIKQMDQIPAVLEQTIERGWDGIRSHSGFSILCEERIEAMDNIGQTIPVALRKTAQGGLAATLTGKELNEKILRTSKDKK